MKRVLSITLAVLLAFGGIFSASAAAAHPQRTVYVASRPVQKSVVEFVRDWFSHHMPAQDICDQTKLTIDQVKNIRVCPAFTVEPFETESMKSYYFPLLYEGTFVGTLLVRWGTSGYVCNIVGGGSNDPFAKALNSLSSSTSAPIIFVVTDNGYFALDSENKVTLLQEFLPNSPKKTKEQKRAIPKMERPSKVVAINADKAYPEQISSEQIVDETVVLTVKNETTGMAYSSNNGGKIWGSVWSNENPPVYVSVGMPSYLKGDGKVPYTIHNRTQKEISPDMYFTLRKWDGQEWASCPETDGMAFNDVAIIVKPKKTATLEASWGRSNIRLEAGRYKLVKKLSAGNQKFTCEAVFYLV